MNPQTTTEPESAGRAQSGADQGPSAGPAGPRGSTGLGLLAEIGILAALYAATARLGQLLAIPPGNITPVWIPSGIILAAVLARGYRVWPGIFLGAFAGNVWAYFSSESIGALFRCLLAGTANGIGDTLCAVGGACLLTRTTGGRNPFDRAPDVIKFIAYGCLLGSGVSALFGVTALGMAGLVPWERYLRSLATWFTGDAVGILVITPMLLAWRAGWRGFRFGREELIFALLLPTASLGSLLLFPGVPGLVILPLLLWASFRFDRRVVFTAFFAEAGVIIAIACLGGGPFAAGKPGSAMLQLQLFLMLMTVPMLVLSGALAESARVREQLQEFKRDLDRRVREEARRLEDERIAQQGLTGPVNESATLLEGAQRRRVGAAILLVGLIATAVAVRYTTPVAEGTAKRDFDFDCREIQDRILSRLTSHEQLLRSGTAFFMHGSGVSRQDWRRFVERQHVEQRLTGIQGVGFALLIPRGKLAGHVQKIRAEGFPDYHVRPGGEREIYSAIVYLEPFAGRNLRAFGYDMFSEPVRRAAMERARDLDAASLSGKVTLVQETDEDVQAGTLMYVPVYSPGMPTGTVDQRRAALQGWVYSPYRMNDLMQGILGGWGLKTDRRIRMQIFDGPTAAPGSLLYDSDPAPGQAAEPAGRFTLQNRVAVAGSTWTLRFTKTGGQTSAGDYTKTWIVIFSGTAASLLLCVLFSILVEKRLMAKQVAQRLAAELRRSDEQSRRSARLLQAVIDHSQCLVYAKDSEGRFILASQPLAAFFSQASHEQLIGKTSHDFLPPETADQHRANDLAVIANGALVQVEETVETPAGPHTFLSSKFPIPDACQRMGAVCGVSFDITERKRAEELLRNQAAELRARNEELERFNRLMVGRELRVIDLKQKVNDLAAELGRPCPYPLAFLDEAARGSFRSVTAPDELPPHQ